MTLADKHARKAVRRERLNFFGWMVEKALIIILICLVIWVLIQLLGPAFMLYVWPQIVALF